MLEYQRSSFAGFWSRFMALIIDLIIVSIIVFPFAAALGLIAPNLITVEVPFGLLTTTTTVSEDLDAKESIEKEEVLGRWTYYYKVTETVSETDPDTETTSRVMINPETKLSVNKTSSSDIEFYILFIYWILLEASVWQASIGKKVMGIKVVTPQGERPTIYQAVARNLLKVLSGITFCIGFMMAGWTDKKQSLHDMITSMLVVKDFAVVTDASSTEPAASSVRHENL